MLCLYFSESGFHIHKLQRGPVVLLPSFTTIAAVAIMQAASARSR